MFSVFLRELSRWSLYLHENSEKQNSDANLQSQFSHVFPAVWRRHVHDSETIRQLKQKKGGPGQFWRLFHFCNPP